jgi:hypothetical protein
VHPLPSWGRCPRTSRQRSRASTDFAAAPVTRGGRFCVGWCANREPIGTAWSPSLPLCVSRPSAAVVTGECDESESALAMREGSDRARARPAHGTGHRPRMPARCASVRESLRRIPAADPPRQRLDRRERRSVRRGAGRRYVGRAPTASGRDHQQAGRDRLIPAPPRVARTFPRARRPPNRRRPGVPLANPHGANRSAQPETGPARPRPPPLRAQSHKHPGASVRRRPPGRLALHWRVAALTAAAGVVHHRSLHSTRPEGLDHSDQQPITAKSWSHGYAGAWHQDRHGWSPRGGVQRQRRPAHHRCGTMSFSRGPSPSARPGTSSPFVPIACVLPS